MLAEEWKNIFKDRVIFVILLIGPIFYTFFFASLYSHRAVLEIPTLIYDEDQSQLSQQIIQALDAHQSIKVVGEVHSSRELRQAIDNGEARAGVIIPADLEAKLEAGNADADRRRGGWHQPDDHERRRQGRQRSGHDVQLRNDDQKAAAARNEG